MSTNLTNSFIDRQNILNNPFAIESIQDRINFKGVLIDGDYRFTTKQIAEFFDVDVRTIERYLKDFDEELKNNGYEVFTGERLKIAKYHGGTDINVGTKTTVLGLFNFRAFLNLAMLLSESDKARKLRSIILDLTIEAIDQRIGKNRKYIFSYAINLLTLTTSSVVKSSKAICLT